LPFEAVLGVWNFSAALQNVCFCKLNVVCLCKIVYACHMFFICICLCVSLTINKLQKKKKKKKIVNFPFICSNFPAAPAYGVYISQLISYSKDCCSYKQFLLFKLKASLRKFYGRHHDVVNRFALYVWPWMFVYRMQIESMCYDIRMNNLAWFRYFKLSIWKYKCYIVFFCWILWRLFDTAG
jgi:hypothetical protein